MNFLAKDLLLQTLTHFGVMMWQKKVRAEDVEQVIQALVTNKSAIVKGMTDVGSQRKTTSDVVDSLMRRVQNSDPDALLHRAAS